ncbi:arginine--tRNA ligase [Allorhodopirellula solitaria]|uniref:Arginine--tRNA ligase n=1 Tax=Allorhodopirellula solitaria TaxID=2527987 RepID=A0A5C5YJ86_9BACT|nr:arginine--tRNA ligase [Allorhodopirellula solitaria]TWT74935.1 Arginine--tRNA ligase [Allorhodopirellula solitaria]
MNLSAYFRARFQTALSSLTDDPAPYAGMIRVAADPKFGDYQSNACMSLGKKVGKAPREVAAIVVDQLDVAAVCEQPEIAGPGFINLRVRDEFLSQSLFGMLHHERAGVEPADHREKILIDYSSPNVAKPMHVGHIRSTVIGAALANMFRYVGHEVITDNHLGDWGTQFGIIIYGYKHFGDADTVASDPVPELAKLYRLTNELIEYTKAKASLSTLQGKLGEAETFAKTESQAAGAAAETASKAAESESKAAAKESKKASKAAQAAQRRVAAVQSEIESAKAKVDAVEADPKLAAIAAEHPDVPAAVLRETAKMHEGDAENRALWEKFLPHCKDEINRVYDRLGVSFDHTLGESFYHDRLPGVVETLDKLGLTTESDGAVCVFLEGFESPMIIQKRDGAYLYATTDLATLQYRQEVFAPHRILYVVDSRQSEHFEKFFAMAEPLGMNDIDLVHVQFGTVLGKDGRPMKTRSGSLIGLESLLNDAVSRAQQVACNPERLATMDPPMLADEQNQIAETVGIGAIKYADLSHHRTTDYRFDVEKMVALEGNTATYVQYSYARTQSILRRVAAEMSIDDVPAWLVENTTEDQLQFREPAERALALALVRFEEAIDAAIAAYAPNQLCDYLFETAKAYSTFNDACRVLGNTDPVVLRTRLALVVMTGRVIEQGLQILGIGVCERM